ncbi:hypothetical protein [Paractinoplanes ferrugineus]|uniref:hypothetical protein n=1 Tax=Paractinoplanes ferrugineus TaxID=113564 RepID=UPI001944730C|nr:hypothetical protein [Actinoplanes ferrugineus]
MNFILGVARQNAVNARALSDRTALLDAVAAPWTTLDPARHPSLHSAIAQLPDHDNRGKFLTGFELVCANGRQ